MLIDNKHCFPFIRVNTLGKRRANKTTVHEYMVIKGCLSSWYLSKFSFRKACSPLHVSIWISEAWGILVCQGVLLSRSWRLYYVRKEILEFFSSVQTGFELWQCNKWEVLHYSTNPVNPLLENLNAQPIVRFIFQTGNLSKLWHKLVAFYE